MGALAAATKYHHIVRDDSGIPYIAETTMKVVELVESTMAYGWSAEELKFQYPFLTLGQIHSALAYYWDHQQELDHEIERRLQALKPADRTDTRNLQEKLRQRGLL